MSHTPALRSETSTGAVSRPIFVGGRTRNAARGIPIGHIAIALLALTSIQADVIKDLGRLRDQLISATSSDRQIAAQALGRMGRSAEPAIPDLIRAMQDQNHDVQEAAAQALGQIGRESVPALIFALKDQSPKVRAAAAHGLVHVGPSATRAVPDLIRALGDNDRHVRDFAMRALGTIGGDAVGDLIRVSNTPNPEVRENAAKALAQIGQPSVPGLLANLVDDSPEIRASAAHALGHVGYRVPSKELLDALIRSLHDPDIQVRNAAVQAFVNVGQKAVPSLIESLNDQAPDVRSLAANSLEGIGEAKPAIPLLMSVLRAPESDVRIAAAHALASIAHRLYLDNDPEAVPLLRELEPALRAAQNVGRVHADWVHSELVTLERSQVVSWSDRILSTFARAREHPMAAVAIVLVPLYLFWALLLNLVILRSLPLTVLAWNEALTEPTGPVDVEIPVPGAKLKLSLNSLIRNTSLIGRYHYHPRVLRAWVETRAGAARARFRKLAAVDARKTFVALPVVLNGKPSSFLAPEDLQDTTAHDRWCLLLKGGGGLGKSTLAFQLALWGIAENPAERLCRDRKMIPILIEPHIGFNLRSDIQTFKRVLRGNLRQLLGDKDPVSEGLFDQLLRNRYLLVILDGLSEMPPLWPARVPYVQKTWISRQPRSWSHLGPMRKSTRS
jgi:HEAT repeat protein